jgi:ParB family chromosome partitioning protein
MTATARPPATAAPKYDLVRIEEFIESPLNPRKYFPKDEQTELVESLKAVGQLVPVIARYAEGGYELAAGHRRIRAMKKAGITHARAELRTMTDVEFLEILTIENLQRVDVTELEEAAGFQALIDTGAYDRAGVAKRIGKSEKFVHDRLKLLTLGKEAQTALEEGKINASHAILLARIEPEQQREVLKETLRNVEAGAAPSVRQLNHNIEQQVREKKRREEIDAAVKQAQADYPDEKKIFLLASDYGTEFDGQLSRDDWKEAKKDTEGRLVGVLAPHRWGQATEKPKLVFFTKPPKRNAAGQRSEQPAYGSAAWRKQAAERTKRAKERERLKRGGELAVRQAFAKIASKIPERVFLGAVLDQLVLHFYDEGSAITDAFCELVGVKSPGRGMYFRTDKKTRGALQKLPAEKQKAAIMFLLTETNRGGQYDAEATERTEALAEVLKLDLREIQNAGRAKVANEPKPQASAKVRTPPKKPKLKRRAKKAGAR